jgi:hypothetical protein
LTQQSWPDPPPDWWNDAKGEYYKAAAGALVEVEKQRRLDLLAAMRAEREADLEIQKLSINARFELAAAGLDRARDSAKFVQTASAALGTAYVAVAGLVFAHDGTPLPPRGFIPAIFFALSTALATGYLAFLVKPGSTTDKPGSSLPRVNMMRKVDSFIVWVRSQILAKAPLLRGAVVALFFAVAFLPIAVVQTGSASAAADDIERTAWRLAILGIAIVVLVTVPFWYQVAKDSIEGWREAPRPAGPGSADHPGMPPRVIDQPDPLDDP